MKPAIRPKSLLPIMAIVTLFAIQVFSPAQAVLFLLIAVTATVAVAYAWLRLLVPDVTILRQRRYGWAQVGDVVEERFVMRNDSFLPVLWAEVQDFSDLPGYDASRAIGVRSSDSASWVTKGYCDRRGIYTLGPLQLTLGDPFGLYTVTLRHQRSDTFVVYPPVISLPPLLDPRGFVRGSGRANVRSLDMTTNASSVREYVPGDALKRIHWLSTARHSMEGREEIYVKEFDLEPSGDLWIVLDMDRQVHVGQGLQSTEEYGVILAASLASQMLEQNHSVGLVCSTREPVIIHPQKGQQQIWKILQALAGVRAIAEVPIDRVLKSIESLMGRGMSVALITPSIDPAWIDELGAMLHQGLYPTALLVNTAPFGGEQDIRPVMRILSDVGIPAHILGQRIDLAELARPRQQEPQYRVLGTGRVIAVNPEHSRPPAWEAVPDTRD